VSLSASRAASRAWSIASCERALQRFGVDVGVDVGGLGVREVWAGVLFRVHGHGYTPSRAGVITVSGLSQEGTRITASKYRLDTRRDRPAEPSASSSARSCCSLAWRAATTTPLSDRGSRQQRLLPTERNESGGQTLGEVEAAAQARGCGVRDGRSRFFAGVARIGGGAVPRTVCIGIRVPQSSVSHSDSRDPAPMASTRR
jgi:hypothetical protein